MLKKCVFSLVYILPLNLYAAQVDELREQAIHTYKTGQTQQAILKLDQLLNKYPHDQKLLADYLVVMSSEKKDLLTFSQHLANINYVTFPEYGQLPLIRNLRDFKHFKDAIEWSNKFNIHKTSDGQILLAVLYAEAQDPVNAKVHLTSIKNKNLTAEQFVQIAYAYRLINSPVDALSVIEQAYQQQPNSFAVLQEYSYDLAAVGSYKKAQQLLLASDKNAQTEALQHWLKVSEFSQRVNNAITRYKYLNREGMSDSEGFAELDAVLKQGEQIQPLIQPSDSNYLRFHYDYLYALDFRGRSRTVLDEFTKLNVPLEKLPAYVRHAIADSYLAERQPQQAELAFKTLLTEKNYSDMTVYTGLYYSYIEQEKYKQAEQLLNDVDRLIPTYKYSQAKGVDKSSHPDRDDYIALQGMHLAYANHLDKSEKHFQKQVDLAPANQGLINNLARVERWRDKPLQAKQTIDRLNGLTPVAKDTRINQMQNAQALGNIPEWRKSTESLLQYYPEDSGVVKSRKELDDRDRATISHSTTWGQSKAEKSDSVSGQNGLKDREIETRINSPWIKDNYRLFAWHQDRYGEYRFGDVHDQRYGVGAEWQENRKALSAILSQSTDGGQAGVRLDWSQWLNDHWQYQLQYDSQANIPLQAIDAGEDGQAYRAALTWQKDESRQIGASYGLTDISDGNKQQEFSTFWRERLFDAPHHITYGTVRGFYGSNSQDETAYFSPSNHYSAELNLSHDWVTWREYERSFKQHFEAGVGLYKQADYSARPTYSLQYQHQWQLSRTWQLNYGVGWQYHPYDGHDEQHTYGIFGFEGRF
ncbi:poly-beta-1,6 N-acetyl-D-glucosamine export porin PgaA [Acinetobacter pittii]|jgi:biofilm PGA synthesis protein PgaA|uniref:poly-beta-1,6 N-acetyl-D-glucosamine export porin PgaA n=1 Tax=Acinetobacter TaxID=469 RepID=UPI000303608F|nr:MULTISPECIES: poly-beta-1,6 N-acetyl-D-glucosamine export porin PgaA [Acinetobacter]AUT33872.1 poly-beta-1,6 N-acetyl-D-glucosamine export porin PgaA [Acinetobacter pittii]AVN17853.1 poly-beta-1,6 N-acetyl-D-glucosamine export porin PgaA [Acinetobacter pittii]KAI0680716.1 poly-beta-1,6 N-acetyl-D-glucosamine export porin PgaA [Acinetobacter pittii]KQD28591.1 poly-beta-1,6 N-acetyl-D-glucosamine export porin PgaA [Acinetobacter pittii]KQD48847.1 poly-beta-1,6 N-acetyl-D-glucosamine export po